jgi:hypothetical protein
VKTLLLIEEVEEVEGAAEEVEVKAFEATMVDLATMVIIIVEIIDTLIAMEIIMAGIMEGMGIGTVVTGVIEMIGDEDPIGTTGIPPTIMDIMVFTLTITIFQATGTIPLITADIHPIMAEAVPFTTIIRQPQRLYK